MYLRRALIYSLRVCTICCGQRDLGLAEFCLRPRVNCCRSSSRPCDVTWKMAATRRRKLLNNLFMNMIAAPLEGGGGGVAPGRFQTYCLQQSESGCSNCSSFTVSRLWFTLDEPVAVVMQRGTMSHEASCLINWAVICGKCRGANSWYRLK